MERVSRGMISELPKVRPIERPLHKKKKRVLRSNSKPVRDESLWSSLGAIIQSESPSASAGVSAPSTSAADPASDTYCNPPSPSLLVEFSGSVTSASTPLAGTPRAGKATKRQATRASASGLRHHKIDSFVYGSDDDSDDDDSDLDTPRHSVLVPRGHRLFMEEDRDHVQTANADLSFQWPPQSLPVQYISVLDPESLQEPESNPEPEHSTEPTTLGPTNKYHFEWRAFPQPQIPPELRREPFSNINCGPTIPLATPYEAFTAIWDREIMEHIAIETNRYAQQLATGMLEDGTICPNSRITKWRDTDVSELYVYFAIIMATGIVAKSQTEEYWNSNCDIFSTSGFTASMRYDRFQLLSKCLHFQNNDGCNPEIMTRAQAKLFKVQPILEHLNNKFPKLYNMSQNIALDESLTMWKGWLDINQFIRNKAATIGIKTYEVCESQTGYLWRFEVYAGHDEPSNPQENSPVSGIVPTLVLRLLDGLEHKGHTIWMDNFYNSPALARELKVRGFDCVGTLRTNRQLVPVELANLTITDMAIGQVCGCTSGDVDLVVWRDKNRVALISTYHGLATVMCDDTLKPSIVSDYNVCMGGVDRKDQMIAMYPIERRRTRIWYKKFFKRLLNVSILNAYILLRSQHPIDHRSFRKTLVRQLLSEHLPPSPSSVAPLVVGHFPAQYDFLAGKHHERLRRFCSVCQKRTNAYCKACNVPLCVFTCFEPHHKPK